MKIITIRDENELKTFQMELINNIWIWNIKWDIQVKSPTESK